MIKLVVRAIIPKDGTYLLVRNKGAAHWCLPGGGVESDEPIHQALERELVEELGVRPVIGPLLFVQQLLEGVDVQRVEFFFLVHNPEDYESIDIATTTHGGLELDGAGFYGLTEVAVLPKFLSDELPELIQNYTPGAIPRFHYQGR